MLSPYPPWQCSRIEAFSNLACEIPSLTLVQGFLEIAKEAFQSIATRLAHANWDDVLLVSYLAIDSRLCLHYRVVSVLSSVAQMQSS